MLLPSALTCDSAGANHLPPPPAPRFRPQALFASPPTSPPLQASSNPTSTIFATCRALQSMLSTPSQMPTPPSSHAPLPSNFKLRLRARKTGAESGAESEGGGGGGVTNIQRKRIAKRAQPPPRGANKRRRPIDGIDGDDEDSGLECDGDGAHSRPADEMAGPSTPKRVRLAPEVLPLGLERADFRTLLAGADGQVLESSSGSGSGSDSSTWTGEEDRLLVELVLEKLRLSKSDWQDCARSLGKDRGSVGKRWKSLMGGGEVGLKRRNPSRAKIHGTWR